MTQQKNQSKAAPILPSAQITRRAFHGLLAAAGVSTFLPRLCVAQKHAVFEHPGLLHSAADLKRMKHGVQNNLSPIAEGFAKLREHPLSQLGYMHHDFGKEIGRNPSVNFPAFDQDANAAYQCAMMAAITGNKHHGDVAHQIIVGWSNSLQSVSGADAVLMAGLGPFKFINAAELLRADGRLSPAEVTACQQMLRRVILPTLIDFAPFANGNWDTAAIKTMLAIAVFCDDRDLFERALLYYLYGDGDGRLEHYIYENGQCQESGRDQQHTQLGLAHMADACEIAWHQGIDLYAALDNRLLKGFEYTAAYILGDTVDFHPDQDRTGKYIHGAISPRSTLRPVYELVLAHYKGRRGLPAPAVDRAVQQLRPEGAGPGADQTGFGTLLYSGAMPEQNHLPALPAPAAVHAEGNNAVINLRWAATRDADSYSVERAEVGGIFHPLQANISQLFFHDGAVESGKQYSYRVTAHGNALPSSPSASVRIFAGLPVPWKAMPMGLPAAPGTANYDGNVLNLRSSGEGICVYAESSHRRLQARFLPQVASQSAIFGVMHREDASPHTPCIMLLVSPEPGEMERHGWCLRMVAISAKGSQQTIATHSLGNPVVQYGRLLQAIWFRMDVGNGSLQASFSLDDKSWTLLGEAPNANLGQLALFASSGIETIDTTVRFDSISLA
jgi:hypothetical protein